MTYINTFFLYSIVGHLFESIIYLFQSGKSGILYGPWTPVYGLGVCILYFFYQRFKEHDVSLKNILFLEFLVGFFLLTFLEWIGGHLLEICFDVVFWDYSGLKFHIGKYIALEISVIWGLFSVLYVRFLMPISDKIIQKIPKWFTWIVFFFFCLDIVFTIFMKSELSIFQHIFF